MRKTAQMRNESNSGSRERILAAATKTAQAHGYSGLNFRNLAEDVGIRPASIYHHFTNKADLGATVARWHGGIGRTWQRFLKVFRKNPRTVALPAPLSRNVSQGAGKRKSHLLVQLHGCRKR
ncbi:hypothetical protein PCAR4_410082 [Paraburkholderia caribensis]|nr:hypothetical protein PCAR4_410082 [Paraburkholderia caribensis]